MPSKSIKAEHHGIEGKRERRASEQHPQCKASNAGEMISNGAGEHSQADLRGTAFSASAIYVSAASDRIF